jgi:hypothetical protein
MGLFWNGIDRLSRAFLAQLNAVGGIFSTLPLGQGTKC